jgi:ferritin-like metal-binding protein YciE
MKRATEFSDDNKEIKMVDKTLNELFLAQLKDIYYAEKKIYRTLPKMAKATTVPELKEAFATHREETQHHIERLEQVFEMIGKRPQAKACEAINGIIAEGEETIEDFGESAVIDTASSPPGKLSSTMKWPAMARSSPGQSN